ncbi:MAG: TldD/PmbA family protein [Cyanobacteria bacterium SZAS TMP-1]|nr:TldD/PmbA family protein [Cyanobacteria bacterium SZAS TMP-1]
MAFSLMLSQCGAAPAAASTADPKAAKAAGAKKKAGKGKVQTGPATTPSQGVLLDSMRKELDRSMAKLKNAGDAPLYFLSYAVYDTESLTLQSDYGGSYNQETNDHKRNLDIDLRVGDPKVDNTHKLRSAGFSFDFSDLPGGIQPFPIEDDAAAIRTSLWLRTDAAFKAAQNKYRKVKTNKDVKVEEDDTSDDFSLETPNQENGKFTNFSVDKAAWDARLKRLSTIFKEFPEVQDSNITFTASRTKRYLVNSEGTNIQDEQLQYRIMSTATTTASDGMKIWLYDGIEALSPDELPNDEALEKMVRKLSQDLTTLKTAPRAEPYAGPAILKNKASGVFFHEIFGHRIEGHRQKDESEGRTFAKKVGKQIMPDFISVSDDPTRQRFGTKPLNGYYKFDDEGVAAQKVSLVDKGILKGFLMSRSPVKDFNKSNGHGRCSPGHEPVARQGNLIVDSSKRVPYEKLRGMLIEEVKKQGKPYGLVFDEIAGGFTMTQTFMPQSFKLLPLRVWRVYADGRPDELLRGVDLVGTPLASLERIMCAAEDDDTFNGTCGAESGWVPVSATSPSLLVGTIEVELQSKDQDKPPLLPAPLFDKEDKKESSDKPAEAKK